MPLEKDNTGHRNFSNKLDNFMGNCPFHNNYERPIVHGAYHAGRGALSTKVSWNKGSIIPTPNISWNKAEFARSKDQFSKVGTGQQKTDYLKAHENSKK